MPLSTSIFQEGLIIPPIRLVKAGETDRTAIDLLLANVRTPAEREGDFAAQIMANLVGVRRLGEYVQKFGLEETLAYASHLLDYAEALTRRAIAAVPDGVYRATDYLDDDGHGAADIPIHLALTIDGDQATLDFRGSAPQTRGGLNAVRAITLSAALYCFRCLVTEDIPANAGCLRAVGVLTEPGTVVDAAFPAGVAGGNVETSQRIVDTILAALAQALPERIPAASQGTMNNVTVGGLDPETGRAFAYYETLAGGMGASARGPGEHATHCHMTNTLNTPVEALEFAYPFLVTRYGLRPDSGGAAGPGGYPGGCGLVREMRLLTPAEATVLSERRRRGPYGLGGGEPGSPGRNTIVSGGQETVQPGKFHTRLEAGDSLRIETPGGGGWGRGGSDEGS
jgi:N-methylhydantoinase B